MCSDKCDTVQTAKQTLLSTSYINQRLHKNLISSTEASNNSPVKTAQADSWCTSWARIASFFVLQYHPTGDLMTSSVCFLLLVIADTTITKSERHRRSLGGCDVNHERIFYAIATWNYAMSGFIFVPTQPGHSEPNGGGSLRWEIRNSQRKRLSGWVERLVTPLSSFCWLMGSFHTHIVRFIIISRIWCHEFKLHTNVWLWKKLLWIVLSYNRLIQLLESYLLWCNLCWSVLFSW